MAQSATLLAFPAQNSVTGKLHLNSETIEAIRALASTLKE